MLAIVTGNITRPVFVRITLASNKVKYRLAFTLQQRTEAPTSGENTYKCDTKFSRLENSHVNVAKAWAGRGASFTVNATSE